MLSEWLVDRPMDFESEWVLKATPVGRRCLVFARKGETVAYSRTGQFIKAFQSALPGGCHVHISQCRRQYAIVDCIFVQQTNTFYLMDALAWNEHKLYESEASFRFFWLQSRYNENQEKFLTISTKNECKFYCLNTYSASDQDILNALHSDPLIKEHNLQLDGLLFFHIKGPYVPGANPLVLWIKPDMVNRVLVGKV
jgi:snurportin-1